MANEKYRPEVEEFARATGAKAVFCLVIEGQQGTRGSAFVTASRGLRGVPAFVVEADGGCARAQRDGRRRSPRGD